MNVKGSIRKFKLKGNGVSWGYAIDIGKDRDGKRQQKVRSGWRLERDAIAAMQDEISKYHPDDGVVQCDSTVTFEAHFAKWMKQHGAVHWGKMTAEQNEKRGGYAVRMFGSVALDKLTSRRIEEDLSTLLARGGYSHAMKNDDAAATALYSAATSDIIKRTRKAAPKTEFWRGFGDIW